eukprot:m.10825 g.10825  ORF g.10825 m.10825 type:complete len:334 (-) comp8504_c0_seq1:37-1038(-)
MYQPPMTTSTSISATKLKFPSSKTTAPSSPLPSNGSQQNENENDNGSQTNVNAPNLRTQFDFNPNAKPRKWGRRQIRINTLDGSFTAAMWTGDGTPRSLEKLPTPVTTPSTNSKADSIKSIEPKKFGKIAMYEGGGLKCPHLGCDKTFNEKSALRKHFQTHGPRAHVCNECGKAFVESSKLKRHRLVHTGEKKWQCGFEGCGKRFSLDFNLRSHFRTHTGDKPYVCPFGGCDRRFAQSNNLKSHILTHTKAPVVAKGKKSKAKNRKQMEDSAADALATFADNKPPTDVTTATTDSTTTTADSTTNSTTSANTNTDADKDATDVSASAPTTQPQ